MDNKDQMTMLHVKSLLNHMAYFIRDDDKYIADEFHTLCRKYCSWGDHVREKIKDIEND